MIGVSAEELRILKDIFAPYARICRFACYGSRVKGGFEKTSDLDVLICGESAVPQEMVENLKNACDNSRLPYIVNFADRWKIDESFYALIEKDLVFV